MLAVTAGAGIGSDGAVDPLAGSLLRVRTPLLTAGANLDMKMEQVVLRHVPPARAPVVGRTDERRVVVSGTGREQTDPLCFCPASLPLSSLLHFYSSNSGDADDEGKNSSNFLALL